MKPLLPTERLYLGAHVSFGSQDKLGELFEDYPPLRCTGNIFQVSHVLHTVYVQGAFLEDAGDGQVKKDGE